MEKKKVISANVIKPKLSRGNSFTLSGGEVFVQPKYPPGATPEVRNKNTSKDSVLPGKPEPKRTLSGKQIACLLELDPSKKKESATEKNIPAEKPNPRRKYSRAPSVAEMLKSKRLEIPSGNLHVPETMSSSFSSNRPVAVKKIRRSPGAKAVEPPPHVINIDDEYGTNTVKEPRVITKPIEIGSGDSDSSDDEFLRNFGTKRNTKRTATELDRVETITIDSLEIKPSERVQGKPIRIIDSPVLPDSDESMRKAKKLKTQSDCIEITEVTNIKKELRLSFSKSPERLLGDAAPNVKPVERKTSDSQNELMELGFTKREHGDSQRDSQRDSQHDSRNTATEHLVVNKKINSRQI